MAKNRANFSYGLPGGRAYYRGQDAYAAQSRENESRVDQQPGYVSAVLQANTSVTVATHTIAWTTTTLSNFIPALTKFGWGYTESTGVFTCMRGGLYQVSLQFRVGDAALGDHFAAGIVVTRTLPISNTPYTYTLQSAQSAADINCSVGLVTDFEFQPNDQVSVFFNNSGGGTRTLTGLSGAGTSAETQVSGYFNLWQID